MFQEIAIFDQVETDLTDSGEPEILKRANVSASFFGILHVQPTCGRAFTQEEEHPGSARTVLLSNALWRRFGGDPSILGRTVRLSDKLYIVIGIMPSGFAVPNDNTEIWVPFNVGYQDLYDQPSARLFSTIARLKTGLAPAGSYPGGSDGGTALRIESCTEVELHHPCTPQLHHPGPEAAGTVRVQS